MWRREKTVAINFQTFMNKANEPKAQRKPARHLPALSLAITPGMFIDPTFVLCCTGIVVVALAEKAIGMTGNPAIADAISTAIKFAFPIVVIAVGYYFFATSPALSWL